MKTFALTVLLGLVSISGARFEARAAEPAYPNKPVRLLMGPAAGGPTDGVGRVLAARLNELWGQPVVVENRPGAGNTIATAAAAKSTPDGYTLHMCAISDTVAPALYKKLPYDFLKDIVAISHIGITPNIFVVHPSFPAKTFGEFITYAKANPGKVDYAGTGVGQSGHLSMELIRSMTGIKVVYVPYKTVGLAITDVLAGRVGVQITNLPGQLENVRAGKVRALAVTSAKRSSRLPEVPAISETLPGYDVTVWYGLCAPAGVSKAIVRKVNADVVQALNTPDTQRRLELHGVDPSSSTPEQFAAFIKAETVKWAKVVKEAGIPPQ